MIPYFQQSKRILFEEVNGNKYLTLVYTNESKEKIKNMNNVGVKSEV